uniref:Uncharacterized protein n=1 Tax=Glossina pallidipes TaxID=7398 RepID=A0A1A9Z726_GLOPL
MTLTVFYRFYLTHQILYEHVYTFYYIVKLGNLHYLDPLMCAPITKGAIYIVNLIIYANIVIHLLSYAPVPSPIPLSPCFVKDYLESHYEKKVELKSVPHNTSTMNLSKVIPGCLKG